MVYLIHFERPFKHARHYLGYTSQLKARLEHHRSGNGSCLMAAVTAAGIAWDVVRTWKRADRNFERKLHDQKNSPARLCPVCRAERKLNSAAARTAASSTPKPERGEAPAPEHPCDIGLPGGNSTAGRPREANHVG